MTTWTVHRHVPYEAPVEEYFDNAEEVIKYLKGCPSYYRQDITIYPEPEDTYEPCEFEAAFAKGLVA